jgi:hypothetical protein
MSRLQKFLEENTLMEPFVENLTIDFERFNALHGDDENALMDAFIWDDSNEGHYFWLLTDSVYRDL